MTEQTTEEMLADLVQEEQAARRRRPTKTQVLDLPVVVQTQVPGWVKSRIAALEERVAGTLRPRGQWRSSVTIYPDERLDGWLRDFPSKRDAEAALDSIYEQITQRTTVLGDDVLYVAIRPGAEIDPSSGTLPLTVWIQPESERSPWA
jgi:hypothetical protein